MTVTHAVSEVLDTQCALHVCVCVCTLQVGSTGVETLHPISSGVNVMASNSTEVCSSASQRGESAHVACPAAVYGGSHRVVCCRASCVVNVSMHV